LGRFLLYGIAGSLAIAIGSVVLLVALLRLLQTETGAFHGNLSWVPYLIVLVLALAIIALSLWRVSAGAARRRLPAPKGEGH
jgi:cell shape-determining protein MreD